MFYWLRPRVRPGVPFIETMNETRCLSLRSWETRSFIDLHHGWDQVIYLWQWMSPHNVLSLRSWETMCSINWDHEWDQNVLIIEIMSKVRYFMCWHHGWDQALHLLRPWVRSCVPFIMPRMRLNVEFIDTINETMFSVYATGC